MLNRLPVIVGLLLLFPIFNIYAGGKQPGIENLTIISSSQVQITFDWHNEKNRAPQKYVLYRADPQIKKTPNYTLTAPTEVQEEKNYEFKVYKRIGFVPIAESGWRHSNFIDTGAVMGHIYEYRIFYLNDSAVADNLPETIDIDQIEKKIKSGNKQEIKIASPYTKGGFLPDKIVENTKSKINFTIQWNEGVAEKNYTYGLYRSLSSGGVFEKIAEFNYNEAPPSDTDLFFSNVYYYQIYFVSKDVKAGEQSLPPKINLDILKEFEVRVEIKPDESTTPAGIYAGIISFANDAQDITKVTNIKGVETGGFVLLDSRVRTDDLVELFNNRYKLSANSGNAVYYAIHKAKANIVNNIIDGKLPASVDSINIVTITNGVDNSSANPALEDINMLDKNISKDERSKNGYVKFLPELINTPVEKYGKTIRTWTLMLSGENEAAKRELNIISSSENNGRHISYTPDAFVEDLFEITDGINKRPVESLVAIMPSFYNGAVITIKIDNSNSITATVFFDETGKHYLTDIKSEPSDIIEDFTRVEGIPEAGEYAYTFPLARNFLPKGLQSKDIEHSVYQNVNDRLEEDSASFIRIYRDTSVQRGSAIVYFVLDNEKAIGEKGIKIVNGVVSKIINQMYEKTVGNNGKVQVPANDGREQTDTIKDWE
ncbi:hypothetical protein FACS1894190_16390 [Spirochaetia bacterium]|nr:hypothetical protein FACS1894190_16390 [Spirochaetia bacterium]